jgi:hypothetical protein
VRQSLGVLGLQRLHHRQWREPDGEPGTGPGGDADEPGCEISINLIPHTVKEYGAGQLVRLAGQPGNRPIALCRAHAPGLSLKQTAL